MAVNRASSEFCDWDSVRRLIQGAFAYMDGRIDPPSSALTLTQEVMTADASKGALLLAKDEGALAGCVFAYPKGGCALYRQTRSTACDAKIRNWQSAC